MRLPGLPHVDHIGLTVPNLDAAVKFYCDVLGGYELYRLGPFDAAELPRIADGRDWTEAHINVAKARLSIAMLSIGPNLMLELFQYDLRIETSNRHAIATSAATTSRSRSKILKLQRTI